MKKLMYTMAALALMAGASFAQSAPESFRALGCDPEGLKPVLSEKDPTVILYWTNIEGWSGCDADTGRGPDANDLVEEETPVVAPVTPETPVDPVDPVDPGNGDGGQCEGNCGNGNGNGGGNGTGNEGEGAGPTDPSGDEVVTTPPSGPKKPKKPRRSRLS